MSVGEGPSSRAGPQGEAGGGECCVINTVVTAIVVFCHFCVASAGRGFCRLGSSSALYLLHLGTGCGMCVLDRVHCAYRMGKSVVRRGGTGLVLVLIERRSEPAL